MPIHKVNLPNGRVGYKWGEHGKVYTGPNAQAMAGRQAQAAYANGYKKKPRKQG